MNVLIADKVPDWFPVRLKEAGCKVMWERTLEGAALTAAIAAHQPAVLLVRSTKVQVEQLDAADSLRMVIRAGAGFNTIDTGYARQRGVSVCNCPGMNAAAVAELTIGHLINMDRRIADNVADLKAGAWAKQTYAKAAGLRGRTLGVLGMGNIGAQVAAIAQTMGMKVVAWDPFLSQERADELQVEKLEDLAALATASDAVTVHLALVPATKGIVDRAFAEAMKPGAFLINTSRAPVVDKEALVWAVQEKGVRAGIDVFWTEPPAAGTVFEDDVVQLPGVYGTHHIGASTQQAQDAVAEEAWRIVEAFLSAGEVLNCVNP